MKRNDEGRMRYFLVEGGHDADPDPEKAGRVRVRDLSKHGENVLTEHLPFSQVLSTPGDDGGMAFNRPPQPGTVVVGFAPEGAGQTGYAHVVGIPHGVHKEESGIEGNISLPFIKRAKEFKSKINVPPQIKSILSDNRTGISKWTKIFEERGTSFSQSLVSEIPSHGASFELAGLRNTPLKQISTALDTVHNVMNSDKLASLPGSSFNIGSLLSSLSSSVNSSLSNNSGGANILGALGSFTANSPVEQNDAQPAEGAMLGNRVDPSAMLSQLQSLLSGASNSGQILSALKNIQSPASMASSLSGLGDITSTIPTAFGDIIQKISPSGEITNILGSGVQDLIQSFLSKIAGIPGAGQGKPLFGESGTPIQSLIERMLNGSRGSELTSFLGRLTSGENLAKLAMRETGNTNGLGAVTKNLKDNDFLDRFGKQIPFIQKVKDSVAGV